jgi:hypothetical protein
MRKVAKRWRVSLEVRQAIEAAAMDYRLRGEAPNAAEIARKLEAKYRDQLPTERTIRAIANESNADSGDAWEATNSTVDARLVLPALAAIVDESAGARTRLSIQEAELIAAIAEAAPLVNPLDAYRAARDYIEAQERGDERAVAGLDLWLAMRPWTDEASSRRFTDALTLGDLPMPRVYAAQVVDNVLSDKRTAPKRARKAKR